MKPQHDNDNDVEMNDNIKSNDDNRNKQQQQQQQQLSILDRNVKVLLQNPDNTGSYQQHNISYQVERVHRLHGTSLIADASHLLTLGPSTFASACTIFHRFYSQCSLQEYDVWSVAMASTLLATKIEEEPHTLKTIIWTFSHLYRKRLLIVLENNNNTNNKNDKEKEEDKITNENNNNIASPIIIINNNNTTAATTNGSSNNTNNDTNMENNNENENKDNKNNKDDDTEKVKDNEDDNDDTDKVKTDDKNDQVKKDDDNDDNNDNESDDDSNNKALVELIIQNTVTSSLTTLARSLTTSQKQKRLKTIPPIPSKTGPVYQEWHNRLSKMEQIILRQLGFTLYWIPDSHPHKFILYFLRVLELDENSKFVQRAWNYCNDSCRLDLCVRFASEVIACTAIYLAAREFALSLPMSPKPWWEVFVGQNKDQELAVVANTILGLNLCYTPSDNRITSDECNNEGGNKDLNDSSAELVIACKGFITSLVSGGSFNDPDSFLWDHQKDLLESE